MKPPKVAENPPQNGGNSNQSSTSLSAQLVSTDVVTAHKSLPSNTANIKTENNDCPPVAAPKKKRIRNRKKVTKPKNDDIETPPKKAKGKATKSNKNSKKAATTSNVKQQVPVLDGPFIRVNMSTHSSTVPLPTAATDSKERIKDLSLLSSAMSFDYTIYNRLDNSDPSTKVPYSNTKPDSQSGIKLHRKAIPQSKHEDNIENWRCAFCHLKPLEQGLGSLYGPYFVEMSVTSQQQMDSPSTSNSTNSFLTEIWVHEDCVVWSNVYLLGDTLFNLKETLIESQQTFCSVCKINGATISCVDRTCSHGTLHYPCANLIGFTLNSTTFTAHCAQHAFHLANRHALDNWHCRTSSG